MKNVELIEINKNTNWQYMALIQNNYDVVLLRNCESILDEYDYELTQKWLNSSCDFCCNLSHFINIKHEHGNLLDDYTYNNKLMESLLNEHDIQNIELETSYIKIGCRNKLINKLLYENYIANNMKEDFDVFFNNIVKPYILDKRTLYVS